MFKMFWKCEKKRYSKGCRCYKGAIGEEIGIIPIFDCVAAWQTMNRESFGREDSILDVSAFGAV